METAWENREGKCGSNNDRKVGENSKQGDQLRPILGQCPVSRSLVCFRTRHLWPARKGHK